MPLFKLGSADFVKGAVTAVFAAAVTVLYGVVMDANFSLYSADWSAIGTEVLQNALTAFVAYLMKNFVSDSKGRVLGA